MKRKANSTAPTSSTVNALVATQRISDSMPPTPSSFRDSRISMRSCSEACRPMSRSSMVAKVMKPRPPSWIRHSSTTWPKRLKVVAVSRTIRPVTHTAEVEVNSASNQPMLAPDRVAQGRESNMLPIRMMLAKPAAMT